MPEGSSCRSFSKAIRARRGAWIHSMEILVPTGIILGDSLTKHLVDATFMNFCTMGVWITHRTVKAIRARKIRKNLDYT